MRQWEMLLFPRSILTKTQQSRVMFWRMCLFIFLAKLDHIAALVHCFDSKTKGLKLLD